MRTILMSRLSVLAMMSGLPELPAHTVAADRDCPVSTKRRHVSPSHKMKRDSKYAPHIGAKEQERARRCYMERNHGWLSRNARSAPVMIQSAKF